MNLHRPVSDSSASCHWLKWFSDQRHFAAAVCLWCWNTMHFQHLAKVGRTMKKRLIFQSTFYWDIATCIAGAIDVGARCGPKAGWTMGVFEVHGGKQTIALWSPGGMIRMQIGALVNDFAFLFWDRFKKKKLNGLNGFNSYLAPTCELYWDYCFCSFGRHWNL